MPNYQPLEDAIKRTQTNKTALITVVSLPRICLIGPRCNHAQPFSKTGGAPLKKCPICNDPLTFSEVMIDPLTDRIKKLVSSTTTRVVFTDNGFWGPVEECDLFPMTSLVSDECALAWLNERSFHEFRELPGISTSLAMALCSAEAIPGPLHLVPKRCV
jgi:hypothetical protein